nr:PD40 domain-containing protein [Bacteroidota bacterium]
MIKKIVIIATVVFGTLLLSSCSQDGPGKNESIPDYLERLLSEEAPQLAVTKFKAFVSSLQTDSLEFESGLNALGYRLIGQNKLDAAVVVFQLNTEYFPESPNVWDSYADGLMYFGKKDEVVQCLEKALELDSTQMNTSWKLSEIDKRIYEAQHETHATFNYEPGENTFLKGPYFGFDPPGNTPEVFAPGIVSTIGGHEFSCTFSPDGKEMYFNRGGNIFFSKLEAEGWTAPQAAGFNSPSLDHEAHITADGNTMFFGSGRPEGADGQIDSYGIRIMKKESEGWGDQKYLMPGMYVTTSANGNLYLTDIFNIAGGGICISEFRDGTYQPIKKLQGGINKYRSAHPCIAPDESFMIFDAQETGPDYSAEADNLFVSFKNQKGTWGEPIPLDPINTPGTNMTASLSPDGKYLFYYANHDIYWVSS